MLHYIRMLNYWITKTLSRVCSQEIPRNAPRDRPCADRSL